MELQYEETLEVAPPTINSTIKKINIKITRNHTGSKVLIYPYKINGLDYSTSNRILPVDSTSMTYELTVKKVVLKSFIRNGDEKSF